MLLSMVVIAKNGPPKVSKEIQAAIKGAKTDDMSMRFTHPHQKLTEISSNIKTTQLIFKTIQMAGFYMDDRNFRWR